jgi:glycosyltransferase involved in cell wall biosynthesis
VTSSAASELVHVHWVVPNGPIGALVARRRDLPLVVSLHGSDVSVAGRSRLLARAARWSFARADAVTAPSEDLLERARSLGARGRLELVPYGVDATAFRPDEDDARNLREELGLVPDDVVVLGVGRFIPVKGFEYLVDAVAHARADVPLLKLVLVGDGDLSSALRARAERAGLGDAVRFTGLLPPAQVSRYLAAADLVAVPSVHHDGYVDGLPNVALEAMSSATPLVASRVGGLPYVVEEDTTGLLVPEGDVDALAGAITRLARDPGLRTRMGEAARARVERELTWEAVARRIAGIYESVTGRGDR